MVPVTGSSEGNLTRSPQSLDSMDQILSNSNLVDNFIDEHQVVPPSYQHATGENFGYPSCHPVSPLPVKENESTCNTPTTVPPVEIPPKKRNIIQGENVRMSASLGKIILISKNTTHFIAFSNFAH